ncbi:MAG: hypothetical protein EXS16_11665 [Gemmataceae bacterium]|nr:hypothetical protein [Gemmataceae bacterium]
MALKAVADGRMNACASPRYRMFNNSRLADVIWMWLIPKVMSEMIDIQSGICPRKYPTRLQMKARRRATQDSASGQYRVIGEAPVK